MPDDVAKDRAGYRLVNTNPNRVRVTHSSTQNLPDNTLTRVKFDTERYDGNSQHSTSTLVITGTLTTVSGSTALTGVGTAFTTELSVGQAINFPGSVSETRVVTGVTNNTAATVNRAWTNSTSSIGAAHVNSALVCTTEGTYDIWATIGFGSSTAGKREVYLRLNDTAYIGAAIVAPVSGDMTIVNVATDYDLSLWDFVEVVARQNTGSTLDVTHTTGQSPVFGWHRIG